MTLWINKLRASLTPVGAFLLYVFHDLHVDTLIVGIVATWLITTIPALAPYTTTLITGLVVILGISVFGNKVADILTIIGDVRTGNLSQAEKDLINLIINDYQTYKPGTNMTATFTASTPAIPADAKPSFVPSAGYVNPPPSNWNTAAGSPPAPATPVEEVPEG
jgi:hypothetical protein